MRFPSLAWKGFPLLPGILIAPWLHAGWWHLLNNLPGLMLLGWLALLGSLRQFLAASAFIIIGSGLLVWLLARPGMHLGASGWVFGLWGLLLARAWFERSLGNLLIALLVLFYYGGWWLGLLPSQGISFEYHLFGALCGVLFAALSRRRRPPPIGRADGPVGRGTAPGSAGCRDA